MPDDRFDRNERLFGKDGQARLRKTQVLIMGAGGLGSHVIAQTALLGAGSIGTVDRQDLSLSNLNRYVGAWHTDPIPGTPKVELAERHVHLIDPSIEVTAINDEIVSDAALEALRHLAGDLSHAQLTDARGLELQGLLHLGHKDYLLGPSREGHGRRCEAAEYVDNDGRSLGLPCPP